jgi:hypothetical protein
MGGAREMTGMGMTSSAGAGRASFDGSLAGSFSTGLGMKDSTCSGGFSADGSLTHCGGVSGEGGWGGG